MGFPCQYHPINSPPFSSSTRCPYQKDKRKNPVNLPISKDVPEVLQGLIRWEMQQVAVIIKIFRYYELHKDVFMFAPCINGN